MGNKQSTENSKEIIHPRLGTIKLTDVKVGDDDVTTMEKVYSVTNEREVEDWVRSISKIKNTETTQVLFLPTRHKYEKGGMCGSSGNVTLTFQDFIFVLDNEIRNRQKNEKPFNETQIWAAKEFQKINEKVGDIRPANIVINEFGQIKLISTRTRPGELDNFNKAIQSRDEKVYLAPQQCNQMYIKTGQYPSNVDKLAAEMFTIGVTLLESATLIDCNRLYKRGSGYQFLRQTLEQVRAELKGKYSQPLVNYILRMTDFNPANRPRASTIFNELQPYESEILNLEDFQFPQHQGRQTYQGYRPDHSSSTSNYSQNHPNYQYQNIQNNYPHLESRPIPYQVRPQIYSNYNVYPAMSNQIPPVNSGNYGSRNY